MRKGPSHAKSWSTRVRMINPRSVNHGSVDSQSSKDQVSFLTQIMRSLHIREVFWDNGPTESPNSSLIPSGEVRHLVSKMSSGLGCLLTGLQRLPRGRRKQRWLLIEAPRCFRSEGSVRGQIISGIIRLPLFPENLSVLIFTPGLGEKGCVRNLP